MFNTNKFFAYLVGMIFLISGLGVALELLSIPFSSVVLLLIGILTLCMYIKFNNNVLKYLSCFFIPTGIGYFVIAAFHLVGISNFALIYLSLSCSFFCVYLLSKKKIFLYITLLIALFVLHSVTNSTESNEALVLAYDCLYVGLSTTILFIFENKTLRYMPLLVAVVAYLSGVLNFLSVYKFITPEIFKMLISVMFLVVGCLIIFYNYFKSKRE